MIAAGEYVHLVKKRCKGTSDVVVANDRSRTERREVVMYTKDVSLLSRHYGKIFSISA